MYISLDLETTGFDKDNDQIIEFGAVRFDHNGPQETLQFLVKADIEIPPIVTYITKIKNEDLVDALPFADHKEEIKKFIGNLPIIGHNIEFDTNFLKAKGIELTNPEYDTHILAGMVLHNLPSYSLEVISQMLELKHDDAHRALDDAIAAMELFIELNKRFEALDPKIIKKIQELNQKANWPLKGYLEQLTHKAQTFAPLISEPNPSERPSNHQKILAIPESSLIEEIPPYKKLTIELSKQAEHNTYITVPYLLFRQTEHLLPDNIAKIDNPNNYISPKRLQKFSEQEQFDDPEISALIKYLIWIEQTKTGLLSELRIFGKEKSTFSKVSVDENNPEHQNEPYILKALEKDATNAALCTHQYILSNPPPANSKLIILDLDHFKQRLHRELSIFLKEDYIKQPLENLQKLYPENQTIKSLLKKLSTTFKILENIFDINNDKNEYSPRCNIGTKIRESHNWQTAEMSFNGLLELSKELGEFNNEKSEVYLKHWKKELKNLNTVFRGPVIKSSMMWLERHYEDQSINLRRIPKNIIPDLKNLLEKYQNFKIIGENLEFEKELIKDLTIQNFSEKSENLKIKIYTDLPEKDDDKIIAELIKKLKSNPGKKALILNSKYSIHKFTMALSQAGVNVISQLTASTGKLKAQLKEFHQDSLLICTPSIWPKLEHHHLIDELYFQKIPFPAPSQPEIVAASADSKNSFIDVCMPKAISTMKRVINRLDSRKEIKTIHILDSRITQRRYGQDFVDTLKKAGEVEIKKFHH